MTDTCEIVRNNAKLELHWVGRLGSGEFGSEVGLYVGKNKRLVVAALPGLA